LSLAADDQEIHDLLIDKRDMLDEYFSLSLSEEGAVETLPMLLKGYTPNLDRLPHFLLCLGTQVTFLPLCIQNHRSNRRSIGKTRRHVSKPFFENSPSSTLPGRSPMCLYRRTGQVERTRQR
jgi:hypothetical protein